MLQGSMVAIVTPMFEDGRLDLEALRQLIDFHVGAGTDGIVVVGTSGEAPTVDFEEHHVLIKAAVEQLIDIGRFSVFTSLSIIPGGGITLIGLEMLAKKFGLKNFTFLPSSFRKKEKEKIAGL